MEKTVTLKNPKNDRPVLKPNVPNLRGMKYISQFYLLKRKTNRESKLLGLRTSLFALLLACGASPLFAMTSADKEEYEKLGLSQVEWQMILDAHMSTGKLHGLLKCGISIPEYFKFPWRELDISEGDWIHRRCTGQSSDDIRLKLQSKQAGVTKVSCNEWAPIQSFFLPGLNQLKRNQKAKGWTMAGIAVASLGVFAGYSLGTKSFQPLGLFFLVPDMLWSGVDMGIQIQHEQNPDAARFTYGPLPRRIILSATLPLR
jgi:hypothetical protein